jgi:hypothetical protein
MTIGLLNNWRGKIMDLKDEKAPIGFILFNTETNGGLLSTQ